MLHLPAHYETSKYDSLDETKIKVKSMNRPGFKFKPLQVNEAKQSNQGTDHLISHLSSLEVMWSVVPVSVSML
jgi:hypothetical protein